MKALHERKWVVQVVSTAGKVLHECTFKYQAERWLNERCLEGSASIRSVPGSESEAAKAARGEEDSRG